MRPSPAAGTDIEGSSPNARLRIARIADTPSPPADKRGRYHRRHPAHACPCRNPKRVDPDVWPIVPLATILSAKGTKP